MSKKAIINSIGCIVLILFTSACTQESSRPSKIQIKLDDSIFGTNPNVQKSSASSVTSGDGPDWGLNDPQSLSDIHCYGIFVHGNEPELSHSTCTNENDAPLRFGPRAGFFPISESGEIEVLPGLNRTIYLAGMSSADGTCPSGFSENPDINGSNYSNPFIIGQATVDLVSGDNTVDIHVQNSFTDNNKIKDCDFFEGGPRLDVILPQSKRSIWVDDNLPMRTVQIEHNGVSLECSRDGGSNYSACDSNSSFIWNTSDVAQTHFVRVTYEDGSTDERNFNPSTVYPGINFVTCTDNFNTSNTQGNLGSSLSMPLGTSNSVLCFGDGVTISDGNGVTGPISFASGNITLIARQGHSATIQNSQSGQHALQIPGRTNIRIVGLQIISHAATSYSAIKIDSGSLDIEFQDVYVSTAINNGSAVTINSAGGSGTNTIRFLDSKIEPIAGGIGLEADGSSEVEIKKSMVKSNDINLSVQNSTILDVENSHIENLGTSISSHQLLKVYNGGTVTIEDSKLIDRSGSGIYLNDNSSGSVSLTLDGNEIIRGASAGGGNSSFITSVLASGPINLNSSQANIFCNEDSAVAEFTNMVSGSVSGGTWADANQTGNTTYPYSTCQ